MRLSQRIVLGYIRTKFKILSAFSKTKAAQAAFKLFCTPQYRNRKKLPRIFEKAERISFNLEGNRINGYRWNKGADKKFLIIHGFESTVINFDRYVKPMIKNGFEVLAFDAPAHGRSSGKRINALIYKNMIVHIVKTFGPVKYFMAHSFGGLALCLALEEIPHDETYQVVLIAPATETITAINSFFRFLDIDQEVRAKFDQIIKDLSGRSPEWFSIKRMAAQMKAQVLWLQDKDDDLTPLKDVEPIIERNYPNIQFIISEGLGHRRIYRDNKTYKAVLQFFSAKQNIELN